jgi:hypothetical protein
MAEDAFRGLPFPRVSVKGGVRLRRSSPGMVLRPPQVSGTKRSGRVVQRSLSLVRSSLAAALVVRRRGPNLVGSPSSSDGLCCLRPLIACTLRLRISTNTTLLDPARPVLHTIVPPPAHHLSQQPRCLPERYVTSSITAYRSSSNTIHHRAANPSSQPAKRWAK